MNTGRRGAASSMGDLVCSARRQARVRESLATFATMQIPQAWALNSTVECHLQTVEVTGSNPVALSIYFQVLAGSAPALFVPQTVPQSEVIPNSLRNAP